MEWAAGWSKIAASTARERPGAALAVVVSVAAALPVMLVALVFAAVAFAALALPLGIATAAWWVTLRPRARGRDSPSSILARLREGTLRLSNIPEGSAEPGSARASLASPRASLTPAGLRPGNPPVDLLVVYSGQTEFKMEGCEDAALMVARRIKEKVEAQHTRSEHENESARTDDKSETETRAELSVALADVSSLCGAGADAAELAATLADFADALVFVVESAVCVETPSDALRAFTRRARKALAKANDDPVRFFERTKRKRCAPFCVVAVSRSVGGDDGAKGSAFCAPRAGGEAGRAFDKALGGLLGFDGTASASFEGTAEGGPSSSPRLCARCDAEIERNGPGVIDRWARETLCPALRGGSARITKPRVLSLSSTHTALLVRHLNARDRVVGCEPWFEDTEKTDESKHIPRVDPFAPDLEVIRKLDPTLVVCAYESVADALRAAAPAWDLDAGSLSFCARNEDGSLSRAEKNDRASLSFEVVTLECPLGRDALERSAAQIIELAAHARLDPAVARAAAEKLRSGVLAIRARAERAFGGDVSRERPASRETETASSSRARALAPKRPQPFVFIEADPDLYSADSSTPLGAALAEGLGVGNIADPPRGGAAGLDARARAAAALARRAGGGEDGRDFTVDGLSDGNESPPSHYPRLPAQRFWNPREPDWWIVAHPTGSGASGTSFADALDAEDRRRHAALREGRVVTLSDALCHAASQWTPELVDVVEAVFQKMLEHDASRESADPEAAREGKKEGARAKRDDAPDPRDAETNNATDPEEPEPPSVALDARFRDRNLRALPPRALALDLPPLRLTALDLSRNELSELPGLAALAPTLRVLALERNWFSRVPEEVGALRELVELNLSRNFLRPSDEALALEALVCLKRLRVLDLRWNRKVYTAETSRRLARALGGETPADAVDVRVTVSFPAPVGAFVGASPADRDASRLRAQLEPWSTLALRRRLVEDFGEEPAAVEDPERVPRAEVVARLLVAYEREGLVERAAATETEETNATKNATKNATRDFTPRETSSNEPRGESFDDESRERDGVARRRIARARGAPVSAAALDDVETHLRAWLARRLGKGARGNVQERPSVNAKAYMILRSPTDFNAKLGAGSRKARQAADKFAAHEPLWRAAERALREADPAFADAFTALAVTYGFQGSPHIDKQNVGPFYGMALGDFDDGTGGIAVELDARTVCVVDTKGRLGKVDGRFPHWVAPWDEKGGKERFSLIYYRTTGEPEPITSAAFSFDDGRCVGVHVDADEEDDSGDA